jgi:hypothetical protein
MRYRITAKRIVTTTDRSGTSSTSTDLPQFDLLPNTVGILCEDDARRLVSRTLLIPEATYFTNSQNAFQGSIKTSYTLAIETID